MAQEAGPEGSFFYDRIRDPFSRLDGAERQLGAAQLGLSVQAWGELLLRDENEALKTALRRALDIEPKTGLLNQPAFVRKTRPFVEGQSPIPRDAPRGGGRLRPNVISILVADLDDFKAINSVLGHDGADEQCLFPAVAAIKETGTREEDVHACRFGGEEFAISLIGTDKNGALLVAKKLQRRINNIRYGAQGERLGVCIGVAACRPGELSYEGLFGQADQAVLRAKEVAGKNHIQFFAAGDT